MFGLKELSSLLVVGFLAACAAAPAPVKTNLFRKAEAPIYSAAAFNPSRLEGRWGQVAHFSAQDGPGCGAGGAEVTRGAQGLMIEAQLCLNGRMTRVSGPLGVRGPGRLSVPGMADWWVIWVDSGYRTLAIATPKGEFGFVLDRGAISPDRLRAAAEIFDFNGYPKSYLKPF